MKKGFTYYLGGLGTGFLIAFAIVVGVFSKTKGEAIKIKVKGRNNSVMFPKREKKERKGLFRRKK